MTTTSSGTPSPSTSTVRDLEHVGDAVTVEIGRDGDRVDDAVTVDVDLDDDLLDGASGERSGELGSSVMWWP